MPFILPLTVKSVKTLPFTLKGPLIVVVLDVLFIITSPPQGFILKALAVGLLYTEITSPFSFLVVPP